MLTAARGKEGDEPARSCSAPCWPRPSSCWRRPAGLRRSSLNLCGTGFKARLAEIGKDVAIDPDRIAQEILVMATRADVREELDRLAAHVGSARAILASGEAVGRKLDFLCQELNREANTLCSKSASLELTNTGLALKSLIDQFREQVQNVE